MQPVQDIQIGTRISRTQFQYTLMDTDPTELALWAPRLLARLQAAPELRQVASDQQNDGIPYLCPRGPRRRDAHGRLHAGGAGHAVRRVRPAPDLARSSARRTSIGWCSRRTPTWQADPPRCCSCASPASNGAQVPLTRHRHHRADHRAARDHAPGAVPVGHAQLRSRARATRSATRCAPWPRPSRRSGCRRPSAAAIPATPRSSSGRSRRSLG